MANTIADNAKLAHTIAGDVRSTARQTRMAAQTTAQVTRFIPHPVAQQVSLVSGQVATVAGQVERTSRNVQTIARYASKIASGKLSTADGMRLAQSIARQVIVVQGYTTRSGRRVQGYTRRK
jgi:hypothetical protein